MLIDGYGRRVDYLKISLTEICNFRCQYCMPEKPFSWVPKENLLSFEELFMFVKVAIDEGVTKIRLTGGEPLLREDIASFIKTISDYKPDIDLALTTNGYLLGDMALSLKEAGLRRINISLDSLKVEVAAKIANKDVLGKVLYGIDQAIDAGLNVKLNMVPLKDINEDEIVDILEFAMKKNVKIRFIEYMENRHANENLHGMHGMEILDHILKKYEIKAMGREGASSSFNYKIQENEYEFGMIDPHKYDFCESCNRIRLTAEGHLIPCLYFDEATSIADAIKAKDIEKPVKFWAKFSKTNQKKTDGAKMMKIYLIIRADNVLFS